MNLVLLLSIAILLAAIAASVVVLIRSGEPRVGLLTALFSAAGIHQALRLHEVWDMPLEFDPATAAALAGLATSALAVFALVALWRTLAERDRIEALHWDAMEGVRALTVLAAEHDVDFDGRMEKLLEIGCARFGLDLGMAARVIGDRYEVIAIHAPDDFPVARNRVFALDETYCRTTLESERPIAVDSVSKSNWTGKPTRDAFRFDAYLGAAIHEGGEIFGSLCFANLGPRERRFTATEKDLVMLMSQWIGSELERRLAPAPSAAPRSKATARVRRRPGAASIGGVDVNGLLERLERKLHRTVGPKVSLTVEREPDLQPAHDHHLPLENVVLSLVHNAVSAMPDGGRLTLTTANLDFSDGEPGAVSAMAPNRYVTLAIRDTGTCIDADALARAFELSAPPSDSINSGGPNDLLPLASIYRMLQRCGGDLSMEVESGRGSVLTVFLPQAATSAARPAAVVATSPGPAAG